MSEDFQVIKVSGMGCQGCVDAVTSALLAIEGVDSVDVVLDDAEAKVSGVAPKKVLLDAINQVGYEAS